QDEVHAPRREWTLEPHGLPDREARRGGLGLSEGVDEAERGDEVPDSLRLLGRVEIAHEEQRGGAWAGAQDICDPLRMAVAPVEVGRAGLESAPGCGELGAYEHPAVEAAAPVHRVGMRRPTSSDVMPSWSRLMVTIRSGRGAARAPVGIIRLASSRRENEAAGIVSTFRLVPADAAALRGQARELRRPLARA